MLIRLLMVLLQDLLVFLLLPLLWWRRARACPKGAFLRLELDGSVAEVPAPSKPWGSRRQPWALEDLRALAQDTVTDPRVAGWLVVIRSFASGTTRATALRRIFDEVRAGGKRVVVYLPEGGGTRMTYLAVAADRVLVGPHSHLAPLGFAVESPYLKGALDELGIEPEVFAQGRYKAAGEQLASRSMSAEQREQVQALLDVAHRELVDALAQGRGVTRGRAEQWIDEGPFPASLAVELGLVDGEAYQDELPMRLQPSRDDEVPVIPARLYARRRHRGFRAPWRRPYIAVVELRGPIAHAPPWPGMPVATAEELARATEAVREDRRAQGVILLVNSPGGSVLVSDRMLHEVRRLAETKPVVACFEDVAASGGYLVGLGAHAIVAEKTTITGSIGVVAVRVAIGALLERLGIAVEVVKRGERSDMASVARPFSEGERDALERELVMVYDSFVGEVARARGLDREVVCSHAEGRVHSGEAALERHLVDALGGFPRALAEVRARIGPRGAGLCALPAPRRWRPQDILPLFIPNPAIHAAASGALAVALSTDGARLWLWQGIELVDRGRR
ncbi:MAG: signal peptide peptidase SppA [Polyangiaceae bacterium]|nr:signal peptide peptidase SppA [Polyangiaceae bacterium]